MPVRMHNKKLREKCDELGIVYANDADAAIKLAARFGIADVDIVGDRPSAQNILLAVRLTEKRAASTYTRTELRLMRQRNGK